MDLDGDGAIDILSGSYSRMEGGMAGLFHVLRGTKEGGFTKAEVVRGTDGEPLILPGDDDERVVDRICTRPTAVDLNGDGKLDIVSGNFTGTFYVFAGEGEGRFAPNATLIPAAKSAGEPISVPSHSDPFFYDWDGDGDLDLVSGSAQGGVYLAYNLGSITAPEFGKPFAVVKASGYTEHGVSADDEHLKAPEHATRVWVDDVDGDGRFDLLVGDSVTLYVPAEGVELAAAKEGYEAWKLRQAEHSKSYPGRDGSEPSAEAREAFYAAYQALEEDLAKIARREMTGYVWVYHQVDPATSGT